MLGSFSFFGLILRDRDGFSFTAIGLTISLFGIIVDSRRPNPRLDGRLRWESDG